MIKPNPRLDRTSTTVPAHLVSDVFLLKLLIHFKKKCFCKLCFHLPFFGLLKVADITTRNNTPSSVIEVIQCSDVSFKI